MPQSEASVCKKIGDTSSMNHSNGHSSIAFFTFKCKFAFVSPLHLLVCLSSCIAIDKLLQRYYASGIISDMATKIIREAYENLDLPFGSQPRKVQYTVYFVARKVETITVYCVAYVLYLG